jgi:hypothetical protein
MIDANIRRYEAGPPSVAVAAGDAHAPAANTAAVVTLAAAAGQAHVLAGVVSSYDAAPTGGTLTIADGTTTLAWSVTAAGPAPVTFPVPLRFAVGAQVTVTLAAGGSGVTGKLSLLGHWKE